MKGKQRKVQQRLIALILIMVMAMSINVTAYGAKEFKGGWLQEDGKWSYYDRLGGRIRNTIKKSGVYWWWLNDEGTLIVNQPGQQVTDGVLIYTLMENGEVEYEVYDNQGNILDLRDFMPDNDDVDKGRVGWKAKDKKWSYLGEDGQIYQDGVYEIDGYKYYFKDGFIPFKNNGSMVDDYYQLFDSSIATERWIPYNNQWAYFDEEGRKVKGKNIIDGIEYDFGTNGYVDRDDFGKIKSINLYPESKEVYVGDTVEIPFEIIMHKKESQWVPDEGMATPSQAQRATDSNPDKGHWEEVWTDIDTDYNLFKNTYAVSHEYRVNMGVYQPYYEEGVSRLKYSVETKFDIDWERQVIKIPVNCNGAIFGEFQIGNVSSSEFGMICRYKETVSNEEKFKDILNQKYPDQEGAINALKQEDASEIRSALESSEEIRSQVQFLETGLKGMYDIESTTKVSSEVQHYFSGNEVTVIGLALSAKDKEKANITFEISKSNETLTEELAKNMKSVALDMKASGGGITSSKLDIPVYITIPLPRGLSGEGLRLFHIHNGETEELNVQVENGKVSFTTGGFSSFIFAEEKSESGGNSSGGGGSSGGGSSSGSSVRTNQLVSAIPETPGKWVQTVQGWQFQKLDGEFYKGTWIRANGKWYWIEANGFMATGWKELNGKKYYLMPVAGEMSVGWIKDGETWYYLDQNGYLLTSTTTPDNYQVNETGAWIQN